MPAFTIRYDDELESNIETLKEAFKQSTKNKVIIQLIKEYPLLAKEHKELIERHDELLAKHWALLSALRERDAANTKVDALLNDAET